MPLGMSTKTFAKIWALLLRIGCDYMHSPHESTNFTRHVAYERTRTQESEIRKAVTRQMFPANISVLPRLTHSLPSEFCGIIFPKANKYH